MGGASSDSGASGSDAGFENTQKSKLTKKNQALVDASFKDRGAVKMDQQFKTPVTAILTAPFKAGSKVNRDFFTNKVLGSKNYKGTSKEEFLSMSVSQQESIYGDYMKGRQTGKTDAYGNPMGGGNDNQPTQKTTYVEGVGASAVSPTKAEVDQTTATTMSADETLLATNKKGRTSNILTSATGLGGTNLNIKKKKLGG
jgi:hypothetical protein